MKKAMLSKLKSLFLLAILFHISFHSPISKVEGIKYGYGFTYVRGSKPLGGNLRSKDATVSLAQLALTPSHQAQLQADSPYEENGSVEVHSYDEWISSRKEDHLDKNQRTLYKNPRNVPSESCPRNEELTQGRQCLRKCTSDEDCKSPRKKCFCDGYCGMSCIKPDKECYELGNPEKGQVILTGRHFGDRAIYTCEEGYRLIGVDFRTCQADGSWSATEPSCQKIVQNSGYCGEPPVVPHARHNAPLEQNSFAVDTELQYQCYPGYNTEGFARARCLAFNSTVKWFGPDFKCEPRSCGNPGDIPNGRHEGECYAYSCRVTYTCYPGFDLVGRANRYCQTDGTWTPSELPICVPVQCPIPPNPDHGKAMYTSISYNSVVTYECRHGYSLVGEFTRRCGPDKKWIGEEPYCKEINCGPPGPIYNGWIENADQGAALGIPIIYRCLDGMKRIGASSATCEKNGKWSFPPPHCLAPCIVPKVEYGKVINVSTGIIVQHGENLTLECDDHYEPAHGLATFTCSNGTWNVIPRCEPARCKQLPPRPRHGMVIAPHIEHGARALFKCKDGFQLIGPNMTKCLYGNWTGKTPTCQEIYCDFPGSIAHGKVLLVGTMGLYDYRSYVKKVVNNRQIMYDCDRGYVIHDGPTRATCVAGSWSPKKLPKCVAGQHPRMRMVRSPKSSGVAVRKDRPPKNELKNKKKSSFSRNNVEDDVTRGDSSSSTRSCEPLSNEPFSQIKIIKPGRNSSDTFSSGAIVHVNCSSGYRLNIGKKSARCNKGMWKPDKPTCVLIPCAIPSIDNAAFKFRGRHVAAGSEVPHNESVEFGCNAGYVVQGQEIFHCWFGEFEIVQKSECTPAPCELPRIQNGDYTAGYRAGLTIASGSTVDYSCNEPDYFKAGPGPVRCHLGEMKPSYPSCKSIEERHRFEDIKRHANQEFQAGGDITEGGKMNFLAERKSCPAPTRMQKALVFKASEPRKLDGKDNEQSFPHGTQISFHCVSGISRDKITWQIICEEGNWTGRSLICAGDISIEGIGQPSNKSCKFSNNEPNLVTFYEEQQVTESTVDFPPGTELVSRCVDIGKYAFLGSVRRQCSRGNWTGMKPSCFGLNQENDYSLYKPPTILFRHQLGPIAQSNDGKLIVYPGTILHMECLWIRRFGTPKWEVSHNYRKYPQGWTEEPDRDRNLEYRLSIFHAQKADSGIFTCSTPTRHMHSVEVVVRDVHCAPIPERKGLIVSTLNTMMNTKVHFSCKNGDSLIGAPEVTCLPSGSWSSPIPFCESVECQNITTSNTNTSNGLLRIAIVSREVGGKALFSCPASYVLRGPTETTCLSNGEWAQPFPRCEEIVCETPEVPDNGNIQGGQNYKLDKIIAGQVVHFTCNPGYMMEGQPVATCLETGKWSGTVPKCIMACTYPGTTIGGIMTMVKYQYAVGETVTFDCSPWLTLEGSRTLRCQKNGKWSGAIPKCLPK